MKRTFLLLLLMTIFSSFLFAQSSRFLLIDKMTGWDGQKYTKLQVLAAKVGGQLTLITGYEDDIPNLSDYKGVIVMCGGGGYNEKGYGGVQEKEMIEFRTYIKKGGNVCFFVLPRLADFNTTLQDGFGVMVVEESVTSTDSWEIHNRGEEILPLWSGITIGSKEPYTTSTAYTEKSMSALALRSYFESLKSDYTTTTMKSNTTGKMRTMSVQGIIGSGSFIFLTSYSTGGGGISFRNCGNILTDENIDIWDNEEAAEKLFRWFLNK